MTPSIAVPALHAVTDACALPTTVPVRRRAWAAFCVAAAAFVLTTAAVGALVPPSAWLDPQVRARMDAFRVRKDDVDLLIVGTSHLYRGIDTDALDRRLAERGHRVRSFNLAFSAMQPIEADALLRRALASRPAALRWVVVEAGELRRGGPRLDGYRALAWHDVRGTTAAVGAAWSTDRPVAPRAARVARHLGVFAARATGLGIGPEALRVASGLETDDYRAAAVSAARARGFVPYGGALDEPGAEERRAAFLAEVDAYASAVADAAASAGAASRPRRRATPGDAAWLRSQVEAVRAAGAEPVYVFGPELEPRPPLAEVLEREGHVALAFDDPARFPDLFDPLQRFDRTHLNGRGAALFSRALADALADRVLGGGR